MQSFAADLARALGDRLVSVVLYGDALLQPGPANLLVIVADLEVPTLEEVGAVLKAWRRHRIDAVLFTPQELAESLDVFPVELTRAKAAYQVLHGEDMLADLAIDPEHLRLQIEEDLRTKRLWLRQRVVVHGGRDPKAVKESFDTLVPVLRALLAWRGEPSSGTAEAILAESVRVLGLDAGVVEAARLRHPPPDLLTRYLAMLDRLIGLVQGG